MGTSFIKVFPVAGVEREKTVFLRGYTGVFMQYLRLKKNIQFQRLFKKGKRVYAPSLTLMYFPSDKTQMGIALSKKHGKAVQRNRLKRQLRAAFGCNCAMLERSYKIVILPKPDGEYVYRTLESDLVSCFKKMNRCEK